uniref:Uncharacterized protein n=1 Tax=Bursaphelenchus xylophilus TaxID=6326 RepID=A0A1I7SKQ6_BURXY
MQNGTFFCHWIRSPTVSFFSVLNYRIELYEVPDKALNESASVASAGSRTFVIIRQNSGRGAFDIKLTEKNRNSQYSQQSADFNFDFYSDKPLYVETRAQPIFHNASKSRSQSDEMEPNQASTSNSNSLYGQTASLGQGNVLETFFVERLHRLKPKWTAKLSEFLWESIQWGT